MDHDRQRTVAVVGDLSVSAVHRGDFGERTARGEVGVHERPTAAVAEVDELFRPVPDSVEAAGDVNVDLGGSSVTVEDGKPGLQLQDRLDEVSDFRQGAQLRILWIHAYEGTISFEDLTELRSLRAYSHSWRHADRPPQRTAHVAAADVRHLLRSRLQEP